MLARPWSPRLPNVRDLRDLALQARLCRPKHHSFPLGDTKWPRPPPMEGSFGLSQQGGDGLKNASFKMTVGSLEAGQTGQSAFVPHPAPNWREGLVRVLSPFLQHNTPAIRIPHHHLPHSHGFPFVSHFYHQFPFALANTFYQFEALTLWIEEMLIWVLFAI